jgi:uncharacterized protein involved in outer membrane biogenesis
MTISKPIRWTIYVFCSLLAFVIVGLAVLAFVRIPIDLSRHRGLVESVASKTIGRPVSVTDKIAVTTSLRPVFILNGLKISNPDGFESEYFISMDTARIQVALLPLLKAKIRIVEFNVHGFNLALEVNKKGEFNWAFQPSTESDLSPKSDSATSVERDMPDLTADTLVVKKLLFTDISLDFIQNGQTHPSRFTITECTGKMPAGEPFSLSLKGEALKHPYVSTIEIGSLKELAQDNRSWMNIAAKIADTHFAFSGNIDLAQALGSIQLKASISGANLSSLDRITGLSLPPLKIYRAGGQLSLRKNRIDLSELSIQVGKSRLAGKMTVDNSGTKPMASVELKAPLIQLNDFDLGDWSPEKAEVRPSEQKAKTQSSGTTDKKSKEKVSKSKHIDDHKLHALFSTETLEKLDAKVHIVAENVKSGIDELGSGTLTANLNKGRISIDPLKLNIPGGSFVLSGSLRPGTEASEAAVRAKIENFDFGVLVHRANPKADMGGIINLDVDLHSQAGRLEDLMARSNGHFDFSGRLQNLKAGIIDMWAVNVIAAIVSSQKDQSKINCILGFWDMKDGVLSPSALLIDTSKIRICGKGQVDFKKQTIRVSAAPRPKKPEFFSLATPMEVNGTFSDFGVGIDTGGLIGTAVRFVTSPFVTPLLKMTGKELPADGADVCSFPIGPNNRQDKLTTGCK